MHPDIILSGKLLRRGAFSKSRFGSAWGERPQRTHELRQRLPDGERDPSWHPLRGNRLHLLPTEWVEGCHDDDRLRGHPREASYASGPGRYGTSTPDAAGVVRDTSPVLRGPPSISGILRVCGQTAVAERVRPLLEVRLVVVVIPSTVGRGQVVRICAARMGVGDALLVAEQLSLQAVVLSLQCSDLAPEGRNWNGSL